MKKIDKEQIMKGFTGTLEITAKCNGIDIEQKIEYKDGNRYCLLYILLTLIDTMHRENALGKDLIRVLISALKDLVKED